MLILVTGGTGFVGSHCVAALAAQGHQVRLLVRSPARIAPALTPLGVTDVEHVQADVTDVDGVAKAIDGCEAVVHAAAVFSLDSRSYRETARTNVAGARTVLDAAVAQRCDPIVHISSTAALLRRQSTVTADAPVSSVRGKYIRSKVDSELIARDLQEQDQPVVTIYPGGVYGPHDPHLSDNMRRLRDVVRGLYPMFPTGGFHAVDVRDVAAVVAAAFAPGRGPRRYVVPGSYVDTPAMIGTLRRITGRRLPYVQIPATAMLPASWLVTAVQRVVPLHIPAEHEGVVFLRERTRFDDSATREELGVTPRSLEQTFTDSVRWLREAGHLTPRQAGLLA